MPNRSLLLALVSPCHVNYLPTTLERNTQWQWMMSQYWQRILATMADSDRSTLKVVSFNMHGFRQGLPAVERLIETECPDIIMLQEHWLTPSNLSIFENHFSKYFSFGSSAMSSCVESGMLRGRPFGGVITLINNHLRKATVTVHCDERFVIVKVQNYLFVNIYLPCSGVDNRLSLCQEIINDIWSWRVRFSDCECVIAGDFNIDLDVTNDISKDDSRWLPCAMRRTVSSSQCCNLCERIA